MPTTEEKVSGLEAVLEEFMKSIGIEFDMLYNFRIWTGTVILCQD